MSGYLGSIGFGYPAAMGAWAAAPDRTIVAVTGDGGFGQYLAEVTTAVKYGIPIRHVLFDNSMLGKISKEQRADELRRSGRPRCTTPTSPLTPSCAARWASPCSEPINSTTHWAARLRPPRSGVRRRHRGRRTGLNPTGRRGRVMSGAAARRYRDAMSDSPQGPGWWQASDGRWYPPSDAPGPGWWQASDGQWYPPTSAPGSAPTPASTPPAGSPPAWAPPSTVAHGTSGGTSSVAWPWWTLLGAAIAMRRRVGAAVGSHQHAVRLRVGQRNRWRS